LVFRLKVYIYVILNQESMIGCCKPVTILFVSVSVGEQVYGPKEPFVQWGMRHLRYGRCMCTKETREILKLRWH